MTQYSFLVRSLITMKLSAVQEILANVEDPRIDGIISINQRGLITAFDEDAEKLLGYSSQEVLNTPLTRLMPESFRKQHPGHLKKAAKNPSTKASKLHLQRTIIALHKSGELIPVAITVSADSSSDDVRYTGILQDLRRHERYISNLYQNVKKTTSALSQRINFEELLNHHASRLLSCTLEQFKTVLNEALEEVCNFISIDHVFVLSFENETATLWTDWKRSASLIKSMPETFEVPQFALFYKAMAEENEVILDVTNDKQTLALSAAQSLSNNNFSYCHIRAIHDQDANIAGCIGFTVIEESHRPNESTTSLFSLAAKLFANAMTRYQLITQANDQARDIKEKGILLANQATLSKELYQTTNNLYQSSSHTIAHCIDETLFSSAIISGHQSAWLYLTPEFSSNNGLLFEQTVRATIPKELSHTIAFAMQSLKSSPSVFVSDINSIQSPDLPNDVANELSQFDAKGITLVSLPSPKGLMGFIAFYNALPIYQTQRQNQEFLTTLGQVIAASLTHHAVQYQLASAQRELVSANRILSQQALCDALTGLSNRRAFDLTLQTEFDRANRHNQPLCLLLCDIDHFKKYNDEFGHPQGDQCLQKVANVLKQTFHRAGESSCRYGGEEFAIILPAIEAEEAQSQAQRLLQAMQQAAIPNASTATYPYVTLSIGLAVHTPLSNTPIEKLIEQADKALYKAKEQGRNRLAWSENSA